MLRLLRLVVNSSLIHHFLRPSLLIYDLLVFQINIKHNQLLIFVDKVLRLVSCHVYAKCIIESIFEGVGSCVVAASHASASLDLGHISCILLRSYLALAVLNEKSVYVKFLVEEGEHGRAHALAVHWLALALLEELQRHLLVIGHDLPVVGELLAQLCLVVSISAIHFLLMNTLQIFINQVNI